ncbi:MAG: hypothetical protein ACLPTF_13120 [Steroidobacteraceae bacterium]
MSITSAIFAGRAPAEPWAVTPRMGISTDYSSNPDLLSIKGTAEEHVAGLLDLPVTYDADGIEILVRPNGRLSNSKGYSSLASNFAHLDADAQFINDHGSTTLQAELARDSSLYFAGGLSNGIGVRRDSASTSADWTRAITERSQIQLDASWSQLHYAQPANAIGLVDYRYISAGPTLSFALSELNTLQLLGSVGKYQSLNPLTDTRSFDARTESTTDSLQLGFNRQLSELWKLTTSAGYSRSVDHENYYFGPIFLQTFNSKQDSGVYAASLVRQGETLNFTGSVSRALQPTGFAFLSRQDSINLGAAYTRSERWDYAVNGTWQKALNPGLNGASSSVRYLNAQLTANWHWTSQWLISMHVLRVSQERGPPTITVASNGVSVDIVRQFLRSDL